MRTMAQRHGVPWRGVATTRDHHQAKALVLPADRVTPSPARRFLLQADLGIHPCRPPLFLAIKAALQLHTYGPWPTKKPACLRACRGSCTCMDAIARLEDGAAYPNRTDDLPLTRRLLYQLS